MMEQRKDCGGWGVEVRWGSSQEVVSWELGAARRGGIVYTHSEMHSHQKDKGRKVCQGPRGLRKTGHRVSHLTVGTRQARGTGHKIILLEKKPLGNGGDKQHSAPQGEDTGNPLVEALGRFWYELDVDGAVLSLTTLTQTGPREGVQGSWRHSLGWFPDGSPCPQTHAILAGATVHSQHHRLLCSSPFLVPVDMWVRHGSTPCRSPCLGDKRS